MTVKPVTDNKIVNNENSHGRSEKQLHESWGFQKGSAVSKQQRITRTSDFEANQTVPCHWGWNTIYATRGFSLHQLKK